MFLHKIVIEPTSIVNNLVKQNHHLADVFLKYDIEYCCGGNWPLKTVCVAKGIEFDVLKNELEDACRLVQLPSLPDYDKWDTDFLINYIINVHHQFLRKTLPDTATIIEDFAAGHIKQYPQMQAVIHLFRQLQSEIMQHITYEEETIFPYIRQIAHAYDHQESYAKLLVKTLRKPLDLIMKQEEETLYALVLKIRSLTNSYRAPEKACISHNLSLLRLKDLDDDLMQHIYLENKILFTRALKIETELLK